MHHTDYNTNLRQTQHKSIKNLCLKRARRTGDLGSAVVAALLVLLALFQMDPANAQALAQGSAQTSTQTFSLAQASTQSLAVTSQQSSQHSAKFNTGFGTLQYVAEHEPIVTRAIDASIKLYAYDDGLTLTVDQTFSNPTATPLPAIFSVAVPPDAIIHTGLFTLGDNTLCNAAQNQSSQSMLTGYCLENTIYQSWTDLQSERSNSVLRIITPAIQPNQTLRVYLNIEYPGESDHAPLLRYTDDFSDEDLNSVLAAASALSARL